ncbi:MAG TPA: tetratricopeptide repeat protein [Sphingomicrobium sp.]|nr:tetratricopeptide repeat protein [Sphingomicrobium sp.]
MLSLLVAAAAASLSPAHNLDEAAHALDSGRLDQARIMIGRAIEAGAGGDQVERLLADHAFAARDDHAALARYEALLARRPGDPRLLERAAIAALRVGDGAKAIQLARKATRAEGASWRAWNALGVAADRSGKWSEADLAYARAAELAPDQAEVLNNHGWSAMLRRQWAQALAMFERAAALDPGSKRIADNLDLARSAIAADLPRRRKGESDEEWAARLNDAGVIARAQGGRDKAIAAFSQAIEARGHWFARAANNLAAIEARP